MFDVFTLHKSVTFPFLGSTKTHTHAPKTDLCLPIVQFFCPLSRLIGIWARQKPRPCPCSISRSLTAINNVTSSLLLHHITPSPLPLTAYRLSRSLWFYHLASHICIPALFYFSLPLTCLCLCVMWDRRKRSESFQLVGIKGNNPSLRCK